MQLASPEVLASLAAAAGAAALAVKKLFARKAAKSKPDYITRAEFHEGMDTVRDRIAAGYMAVTEKMDVNHRQLHSALGRQAENIERRLDQLDTAVARLDERTASLTR